MELGRLIGQKPDLVDRKRLDPVVLPVIGVPVQSRLGQQSRGQGAGGGRLAEAGLADKQVCVRKSLGVDLRSELIQRPRVPGDAGKRILHEG